MKVKQQKYYDFDDVLIEPKPSTIESREHVDLYQHKLSAIFPSTIPIIAANIDTIGCFSMAVELAKYGLMTCLHKHYSSDQYVKFYSEHYDILGKLFHSIGTTKQDYEKLVTITKTDSDLIPHNICLDVAHAEHESVYTTIDKVKQLLPDCTLMVGNVATPHSLKRFSELGVNIVKVGIGGSRVCTTRPVAGVGVPQLSAVDMCVQAAKDVDPEDLNINIHICSDGGCKVPADIAKAFGVGASAVMVGTMFAGANECEGDWFTENGERYLLYYGMSSSTAQEKHGQQVKQYRASEGRTVKIKNKGPVSQIILQILGGLRSTCTYTNSRSLLELPHNVEFIEVQRTHDNSFDHITTRF